MFFQEPASEDSRLGFCIFSVPPLLQLACDSGVLSPPGRRGASEHPEGVAVPPDVPPSAAAQYARQSRAQAGAGRGAPGAARPESVRSFSSRAKAKATSEAKAVPDLTATAAARPSAVARQPQQEPLGHRPPAQPPPPREPVARSSCGRRTTEGRSVRAAPQGPSEQPEAAAAAAAEDGDGDDSERELPGPAQPRE